MTEPQDVLAEALDYSMGPERRRRLAADILVKLTRAGYALVRTPETPLHFNLQGSLGGTIRTPVPKVRTPETLDVERLANALDSVDIDEFDTLGAFNSTGYARAILAVLPFAATPSPTPPEGLLTELAERHLDRRYPPPGHAAWREPELPASEWRAAYFVLARIALEQLDECRAALAASPAPDPGAGLRLCPMTLDTVTWGVMWCGLFAGHPDKGPDDGHRWFAENHPRPAASPAPDPGADEPCLNCNGTGFYMLDGARRPCLWDHGPEQRPVGVFDFGEQSRRWLVDKHGEATVMDFEYAVVRALERAPLREAAQRVIAWADHHEPWNPSGDFAALRAALTPSAEPPETET